LIKTNKTAANYNSSYSGRLFFVLVEQSRVGITALQYPGAEWLLINSSLVAKITPATEGFYIADQRIQQFAG
jgi:hypothetical protein